MNFPQSLAGGNRKLALARLFLSGLELASSINNAPRPKPQAFGPNNKPNSAENTQRLQPICDYLQRVTGKKRWSLAAGSWEKWSILIDFYFTLGLGLLLGLYLFHFS